MSDEFKDHLKRAGTDRHLTVHDSLQSNGAIERSNRTHPERARAMMFEVNAPKSLWKEAVSHSVWITNWTMTRALKTGKTPYEMAMGEKPNLIGVPIWGSDRKSRTQNSKPTAQRLPIVIFQFFSTIFIIPISNKHTRSVRRAHHAQRIASKTLLASPRVPQY